MVVLTELIKILSEDAYLLKNREKFMGSLEISEAIMGPLLSKFVMGVCTPYELIKKMLSEWISIKKDSATIAELRRNLRQADLKGCSDKLKGLQEMHPGPIKIPKLKTSRNFIIASILVSFVAYLAYGIFSTNPSAVIPQPHSSGNPPSMEITKHPMTFGLKNVVQDFTGREEELTRLNEHFHSKECPIVLVSGLGGIGKTELAKKFALDIPDPSGNSQIVKSWLSGENSQSLLNSITQFCHHLQLTTTDAEGKPLGIQEMIQNIMAKLKSSAEFSRWVIIIDNVDDMHDEFETALTTLSELGHDAFLLITSRRIDIFPGELELFELTKLQLTDSMTFVKKSLKIADDSSEEAVKSFCLQLDNLPLALSQSVAFIKQQQTVTLKRGAYSIQNYLDELAKNQKLGLDKNRKLGYSTATLAVWNITIDKIRQYYGTEGQIALDLLDAMAFINPDNIPIQFLYKLYQRFYSLEEIPLNHIEDSLTLLVKYSLISSYDEVLSIHRLVQLSVRDRMSRSSAEDGQSSKDLQMLSKFWTSFDPEEWSRIVIGNILAIWNHSSKHEELNAHRASKILDMQSQLHVLGMVNEAYDFSEECKFVVELYEPEDAEYYEMEISLAAALKEKGQYESALQKFTSLHSKLKELLGTEDELTIAVGYYIASVLCDLERFEESLEWGQKVLQSQIKINKGEKNERVMTTKHLVAMALDYLGKATEVMQIYNEVLEWQEANLEANHPSFLTTRQLIATCFFKKGMFAEALAIFQDILPQWEKVLGPDHPDTVTTKGWLADTLFKIGEMDQSLKIFEEVLVAREKVLGAEHPNTIKARDKFTLLKELN